MTDYSKFTVVQIRELFKSRNIPTTGLTRKQQLIDRLLEEDANAQEGAEHAALAENDAPHSPDVDVPEATDDTILESAKTDETVPTPLESESKDAQQVDPTPVPPTVAEPSAARSNADPTISTQESGGPEALSEQSDVAQEQGLPSAPLSSTASPGPEESRKRKRRSATPSVSEEEIAQKKAKQEADGAAVLLKEDVEPIEEAKHKQDAKEDGNETLASASASKLEEPLHTKSSPSESSQVVNKQKAEPQPLDTTSLDQSDSTINQPTGSILDSPAAPTKLQSGRENRYKDLMAAGRAESSAEVIVDRPVGGEEELEERDVAPALHPATSALYIRDFMRPLRAEAVEAHLASLALPPRKQREVAQDAPQDVIYKFHLDAIRTHCFVVFSSVSAASRVRSAIHDRIWPAEGNRKPLWADFVPEDKIQAWIDIETNTGSGGRAASAKRWEIVYERQEDGTIVTSLEEASAAPIGPRRSTTQGSSTAPAHAPSAPGPQIRRESSATNRAAAPEPASFVALDSLFKSTTAKPKLYYLPVSTDLANRRLNTIDALTTKHNAIPPGGSGYPDSRRYTFENDDMLVDNGPEFGLRAVRPPPRQFRGR